MTDHTGLKFIENKGQWDPSVQFAADIPGGKLHLKKNQLHYTFYDTRVLNRQQHSHLEDGSNHAHNAEEITHEEIPLEHVQVIFNNANTNPGLKIKKPSTEVYNYYLSNDPNTWAPGCKAYEEITYRDLYPGINLRLYTQDNFVKYDLILEKGADPEQITFSYHGLDKIAVKNKQLYCETKINTIIENVPYAYQIDNKGKKKEVSCEFQLKNNEVSFHFPEGYDHKKKLVIDPQLIFSTFSGSVADNWGYTACFDDNGNLYSGGIAFGTGFPTTGHSTFGGGAYDIGILKYDSTGQQLLYATYLGGLSQDTPHSLIVNNHNELLILGTTGSSDYPTSAAAYDGSFNGGTSFNVVDTLKSGSDIVLTKLNQNGELVASTFVGGPGNDGILKMTRIGVYNNALIRNYGDYIRGDVIVDKDDNVYVASSTDADGFPTTSTIQPNYAGGNSDAVIFKMSHDLGNILWSTYLGATADDAAYSIKIDTSNFVYIGGGTNSPNFPSTPGVINENLSGQIDGFVAKIDVDNDSIAYSTFLGTSAYDQVYFIDIDKSKNVYAFGQTKGNYPVTPNAYNNPNSGQFIHKLTNQMDSTIFSTVFGSGTLEPNISPTAFLVNECENIFLSGWGGIVNVGNSLNRGFTNGLPVTKDAIIPNTDGSDFYLMALSANGEELLYATFFGSTNARGDHVDGGTSRFDKRGIIYQSVCSCGGSADSFPVTPGAWSSVNRSSIGNCNNAAFKFDLATLEARLQTNNLIGNDLGVRDGCAPLEIMFLNQSFGGVEFLWNFGDGNTSTQIDSVVNVFEDPGAYFVTLTVRDINTCTVQDVASAIITVHDVNFKISGDVEICGGESTQLSASGGVGYIWTDSNNAFVSDIANPIVAPDSTSVYKVNIIDSNGCTFEDSLTVTVIPQVIADFEVNKLFNCESVPIVSFENKSVNAETFLWDFGDGNTSDEISPVHRYEEFGDYEVALTVSSQGCLHQEKKTFSVSNLFIPNVITLNSDGNNEKFQLLSGEQIAVTIFNRWGKKLFEASDYQNDWPRKDVGSGVYYYEAAFPNGTLCNGWVQVLK
ncbi:PKD domain-containing protein [Fulvivirgaceae bacterium BMA12]|uniref:PKD domain-containing protein n=1 Tax=Agaribacillus aureus TaxID=3051825 RepID=A0ABT8L0L5_9BACT|nr:PKD domain-containing protein [Fulvivirgaceae bacterium BMA12]